MTTRKHESMHQASDEHEKKDGGRRFKSLRKVYEEIRLRLGCYTFVPAKRWIEEAWKQEKRIESKSNKDEIILAIETKSKTVQFEREDLRLEGKILNKEFKLT